MTIQNFFNESCYFAILCIIISYLMLIFIKFFFYSRENKNIIRLIKPVNSIISVFFSTEQQYQSETLDDLFFHSLFNEIIKHAPLSYFEFIMVCVTVIPCLFLFFAFFIELFLKHFSSNWSAKYVLIKKEVFYKVLRNFIRLIFLTFFLEIFNVVNWTRKFELFNSLFISEPFITFLICLILFLQYFSSFFFFFVRRQK